MSDERPGLLPRGKPKRQEGWGARIAKLGIGGTAAVGFLLLAWAQLFPCAARRAGLKAIKLGVADFEVPACLEKETAPTTTTTSTMVTSPAPTSTTLHTPPPESPRPTTTTSTTLAPLPTPTPCPTAGWARPAGGPKPGCDCGTQVLQLKPSEVFGYTGHAIGIEWEANPICRGQEGLDNGSKVDWGDGSPPEPFIPTGPSACFQHVYPAAGMFRVQIAVRVRCLDLNNGGKRCRDGNPCRADGELIAHIRGRWAAKLLTLMSDPGAGAPLDHAATMSEVGEHGLLRHLRSRIPLGPGVVVGVGDDAAAVETGALTLVTTDILVEGVHFRREWGPAQLVGRKALTINLSDIAAMAGVPRFALVSLSLPADLTMEFVDGLYDGLLERAAEVGVLLVGGNVSSTPGPLSIDVTLLGQGDKLLRREGAQKGDLVVVTGTLGAAAAGLGFLEGGTRLDADGAVLAPGEWKGESPKSLAACVRAQLDPTPPLAFGRALSEHDIVHAAMDLSDGLSGDLLTLCQESSVSAWIDPATLPVDPAAAQLEKEGGIDGFTLALHGGEDYQLLLAVPPESFEQLKDVAVVWDLPVTAVGEFMEGPAGLSMKFGDRMKRLRPRSHEHFREAVSRRADPGGEA
jgi:thiamine-monophosphate kinase